MVYAKSLRQLSLTDSTVGHQAFEPFCVDRHGAVITPAHITTQQISVQFLSMLCYSKHSIGYIRYKHICQQLKESLKNSGESAQQLAPLVLVQVQFRAGLSHVLRAVATAKFLQGTIARFSTPRVNWTSVSNLVSWFVDTSSELFRFQCEVRQLIRLGVSRPRGTVRDFLIKVEAKRGKNARDALEKAYREQYGLGNRGAEGVWISGE